MDHLDERARDEEEDADVERHRSRQLQRADLDDVLAWPWEVGERRIAKGDGEEADRQREQEPRA